MFYAIYNFNFLLWQEAAVRTKYGLGALIFSCIFIIFIILAFIALGFILQKKKERNIQTIQTFAAQNGWQFVPNANLSIFQKSNHYSLFMNGRSKELYSFIQKPYKNGQMFVFQYEFIVGEGSSTEHYSQTVTAFHSSHLNLPYFSLYPESNKTFIGKAFGYNDVNFASHPHFSTYYRLSGVDERAIRQAFHPQLLSNFEQLPIVNIDGGGNYIFVYELGKTNPVENINWFINEKTKFVNLF